MKRKQIPDFVAAIKKLRESATDELALESVMAFAEWKPDADYAVGDRVRYGETLFRCVQAHTSQPMWIPEILPALWTEISLEEYPEWRQPLGAEDAYHTGDKVSFNEKHWVSTVDGNVWQPSVYGWDEVTE